MLGDFDFHVYVLARHPEADVSELAVRLGQTPKHVSRSGMPIVTPTGVRPGGTYFESRCLVEVASNADGTMAECVFRVASLLEPHREFIDQITKGGGVEVFVRWYPNGDTGESFPPDVLTKLGSLGVTFGFNVYGIHP